MLDAHFIDWWFAPWRYAIRKRMPLFAYSDELGRRDGYDLWCAHTNARAALPDEFDPGWQVAALENAALFARSARLYGGLIAARAQNQFVLARLPIEERRWCLSVAITQPLKACAELPLAAHAGVDLAELYGVVELAHRLERGFPGMWSRLRLLLDDALASRAEALLPAALAGAPDESGNPKRAQRCWQMCMQRAHSVQNHHERQAA